MKIKTTPPRSGQKGFTLIEIVMVLVLLGILAAVAVPKYFDLQKQAEKKAAQAVVQEAQARLNGMFAQELLNGGTCQKFVENRNNKVAAVLYGERLVDGKLVGGVQGNGWVIYPNSTDKDNFVEIEVYRDTGESPVYEGKIHFPICNATPKLPTS